MHFPQAFTIIFSHIPPGRILTTFFKKYKFLLYNFIFWKIHQHRYYGLRTLDEMMMADMSKEPEMKRFRGRDSAFIIIYSRRSKSRGKQVLRFSIGYLMGSYYWVIYIRQQQQIQRRFIFVFVFYKIERYQLVHIFRIQYIGIGLFKKLKEKWMDFNHKVCWVNQLVRLFSPGGMRE